jgi:mannitol/fructose-specific phosphotransferase system IIA component (Ntr-type)
MKSLSRLLSKDRIIWLDAPTKEESLKELVFCLARTAGPDAGLPPADDVFQAILEREKLLSTGFGLGLAIPHAKLAGVKDFAVGLGIHRRGLSYESIDDKPVHILVMILCPSSQQEEYLRVLSRVTSFLKDNREGLLKLQDSDEVYRLTVDY